MHTLQAFQYGTVKKKKYLDFSHADLGHADFSQSKKRMSQGPAILDF